VENKPPDPGGEPVFTGTDSSVAISCRGRFAGRYRSTFRGDQL